jgi:two-component system phosphate regulon sensor histidine kinase PhoR
MPWFIVIVLLAISIALFRHILRLRRLLGELDDSVRSQRRLLPQDSIETLQKIGALGLVDSLNALIDSHNQAAVQKSGYSNQIEAMLGAVQEVIIVFNEDRVVEYANRSAEKLFRDGGSIQGDRLEGVLRSVTLLELLEVAAQVERTESTQINIEQGSETLWFEASCAKVRGLEPEGSESTLLVLHDITKLKGLEVMRREFVANVSHELRTPLTIIKGFAETLIDDEATLDAKARSRFTSKILNNAERLHVLVEDLLTISRLESQPGQIEPIEQPLEPLLVEVADNYRTRIDPEKQKILVQVEETVGSILYDRYRINQVLDNFIENVFRYAPEFTELRLEAVLEEEGRLRCSVIDDGPGIPEKDLPHIFERFYRVDKGRSRETGGTGLGLSIVKHIIQLHGGSVQAESIVGEGTRMSFRLPVKNQ